MNQRPDYSLWVSKAMVYVVPWTHACRPDRPSKTIFLEDVSENMTWMCLANPRIFCRVEQLSSPLPTLLCRVGRGGPANVQSLCAIAFYHSGRAEVHWSQVTIVLIILVCYLCPIMTCGIRLQEPNPVVLPSLGPSPDSHPFHDARIEGREPWYCYG